MLSRVNIGSSYQLVPGVQRTYTGLTANGVYRFTANVNYLSTGGGGIGGFSAGEMSSLVTTVQDSLVISYTNGSGVSVTIAKLRYNNTSSFPASLTFTVPSGVTAIKAEFVPGNTSGVAGYGYFVDNLRLARMTGAGFYTSNFVTTSISASNTDGWSTNWATSYMNVLAGPPNKLRASGQSPNISRNFTVTPNDACAFSYTQSENNSVSLVIEQSPNGTSGWSTLMNITSVNGTHVWNFTPMQAYVRVRMSGGAAFSLADVTLKSTHVDRTVVEIPGKGGYRYGFQNQEMDDEIKGPGNSLNFEYRMHDPRIGRFFAIDPLASKYPYYSPYAFSGNQVIHMVELEGLEPAEPGTKIGQTSLNQEGSSGKVYQYTWGQETSTKQNWIRGAEYTGPTVSEYAKISNHSYNLDKKGVDPGPKEYAGNTKYVLQSEYMTASGFKAGLYKRTIDGVSFFVLATAGTDDARDGLADVQQGAGGLDLEVPLSLMLAKRIDKYVSSVGGNLSFTGHSLGGGLAAANAKLTGRNATTFNAMGLHPTTKNTYGLNGAKSKLAKIDAYIIRDDAVNTFQIYKADGVKHFRNAKTSVPITDPNSIFINDFKRRAYNHSMDRFLEIYK